MLRPYIDPCAYFFFFFFFFMAIGSLL